MNVILLANPNSYPDLYPIIREIEQLSEKTALPCEIYLPYQFYCANQPIDPKEKERFLKTLLSFIERQETVAFYCNQDATAKDDLISSSERDELYLILEKEIPLYLRREDAVTEVLFHLFPNKNVNIQVLANVQQLFMAAPQKTKKRK